MGRDRLDHHRFHVGLERSALARLDALVGPKGRAEFVRKAVDQMLDQVETAQAVTAKARPKPE